MTKEEIARLTEELIGTIEPHGSTHIDTHICENMKVHIYVLSCLLESLNYVIDKNKGTQLYSVKEVVELAENFKKIYSITE